MDEMNYNSKEKVSSISFSNRLNNMLEMRLGKNQKTLEALAELSTFLHENSLNSRRTLRSKVEKRGIGIIQNFLDTLANVKNSLDYVYNSASKVNHTVDGMINLLEHTKTKTSHLRDRMNKLQADGLAIQMQQVILQKYIEKFQLNHAEIELLQQPNVTFEFFSALEKTHTIHNNCQLLLRNGNQTLALSVMEQMTSFQETAAEFVYRWVQIYCKDIESPKTAVLLAKAMKQFQNRTVLFSNLIDEYSTTRRSIMVRLFIDALTKGGPGGFPKPIETYAQDKKRYVGDMLAWLRQFIPMEKENFSLFLKDCNTSKQEIKDEMSKGLSKITEGICSLLSVRIEFIISSSPSPFELYDTTSLLRYYSNVLSEELPDSYLAKTLSELKEITESAFLNSVQNLVRHNLLEKIEAPASDLTPSPGIGYLLNFMTEILSVAGLTDGRKEFIVKIVNCVIDPLLQAVNLSASRLTSVDMAVYMLNCLDEIIKTLSLYEFVDDWLERLQAQIDAQIDTLTSEQASSLVANLNLSSIYTILQDTSKVPLAQVPGMDPRSLQCFMNKFENYLSTPHMLILPQVNWILNSSFRIDVQKRANEVIIAVYKQLYKSVVDPINLYQDPYSLMPHSVADVESMLLSVEENNEPI